MERINIYNEEQFDYEIKKDKNEMNEDTKILKLSSGEEVICNVVNNPEKPFISVVYPMKMQSYPKATRMVLKRLYLYKDGFILQKRIPLILIKQML